MKAFLAHLNDPAPGFHCFAVGDYSENTRCSVRVRNRKNPGATAEDLSILKATLGEGYGEIASLYAVHDGLQLYCQGDIGGIEISPIAWWPELNRDWRKWFEDWEEDDLFVFQRTGVAFGQVCHSGNYFVFHDGVIYYGDHDGGDDTPVANSFFGFLERITSNPAKFLEDMGCYTRYEDGRTETQWIPKIYVPNMNDQSDTSL